MRTSPGLDRALGAWHRVVALADEVRADPERRGRWARVSLVAVVAAVAGAIMWTVVLTRATDGRPAITREGVTPIGGPDLGAASVAGGGGTIWTLGLRDRRLAAFPASGADAATTLTVGAAGDLATAVATGDGAVWVALQRSGNGLVVRVGADGSRIVRRTGDLLPERIAVLPARVVAIGGDRVTGVPTGSGRPWSRVAPGAIDVAAGYGSVWVLSRQDGGRGLVTRRDPTTGRVTGRRAAPAGPTAIAVGLGAVWVANGCPDGVLRAPVGPGPGVCARVGKGPVDIAVGGGSAWAADAAGRNVVELDAATGAVIGSWLTPGRPAALAVTGEQVVAVTQSGTALRLGRTPESGR